MYTLTDKTGHSADRWQNLMCTITHGRQLFGNVAADEDGLEVDPEVLHDHPLLDDVRRRRQLEHPVLDRLAIRNVVPSPTSSHFIHHNHHHHHHQFFNKKHLKNVGPIRHCEPPHAHSPGVATVARRLRIDVHNNIDNNNA